MTTTTLRDAVTRCVTGRLGEVVVDATPCVAQQFMDNCSGRRNSTASAGKRCYCCTSRLLLFSMTNDSGPHQVRVRRHCPAHRQCLELEGRHELRPTPTSTRVTVHTRTARTLRRCSCMPAPLALSIIVRRSNINRR